MNNIYEQNGFHCPLDGVYRFISRRSDGTSLDFFEEFVNKNPTGKFGGPPDPFGKIITFSLVE